MASITQNKKDGKVISYKFKACIGRDEFGKQIFRCTTWKAPDGLSAARIEKVAQKAAAEWEKQAKEEFKKGLRFFGSSMTTRISGKRRLILSRISNSALSRSPVFTLNR